MTCVGAEDAGNRGETFGVWIAMIRWGLLVAYRTLKEELSWKQ